MPCLENIPHIWWRYQLRRSADIGFALFILFLVCFKESCQAVLEKYPKPPTYIAEVAVRQRNAFPESLFVFFFNFLLLQQTNTTSSSSSTYKIRTWKENFSVTFSNFDTLPYPHLGLLLKKNLGMIFVLQSTFSWSKYLLIVSRLKFPGSWLQEHPGFPWHHFHPHLLGRWF